MSTDISRTNVAAEEPLPAVPVRDSGFVEIRGLNHAYGEGETRTPILKNVNLNIPAGELVILEGPSGSGKSTLLVLVGTLRAVQEGSVRVGGTELFKAKPSTVRDLRRKTGFIFQAHNLFDSLTAYQNVKMGLQLAENAGNERQIIEALLTRLGLGERLHYYPAKLSGGQRQRVAIARGLVHKPQLILADEPTAALDGRMSELVVTMLRERVQDQKCTVLMVTHDQSIMQMADRIITLKEGRIVRDVYFKEIEVLCRFLHGVEVFNKANHTQWLAEVAAKMQRQDFRRGETVIHQDDSGQAFHVIRSGAAEVLRSREPHSPAEHVATLCEGEFFGEMSLERNRPTNASVVAASDLVTYALTKEDFQNLLEENTEFAAEIRRAVGRRL